MGHCISVYLINKSELRNEKIDSLKEGSKNTSHWTEMNSNILATTHIPNIREWGVDKTIAKVETDYFGGSGNQSAKLFVNNKKVLDYSDEYYNEKGYMKSPINEVLKSLGVIRKEGLDEFDTVGLGKYRSNYDFQ
jgi:hypothetical protein